MLLPVSLLVACLLTTVEFAAGSPASAPGAPPTPPAPPTINWEMCGDGAVCGVADSCLKTNAGNGDILKMNKKFAEIDPKCKSGISIRPLSAKVWIVKLQLTQANIAPVGGLYLYHDGEQLFGCALAGEKVIAQTEKEEKIDMYSFEQSRLIKGDFYCSFIIKDAKKLISLSDGKTTLEYVISARKSVLDTEKNSFKAVNNKIKCDIDKAQIKETDFYYDNRGEQYFRNPYEVNIYQEPESQNVLSMDLTCEKLANSKLYASYGNKLEMQQVERIECDKGNNGDLLYTIDYLKDGIKIPVVVGKDEEFQAFCLVPKSTVPSIDWSKCGEGVVCGVRNTADCIDNPIQNGTLIFGDPNVKPGCKAGIWIRPLNSKVWIVKMQVRNEAIDPVKGMFLNHTGITLFGCNLDNVTIEPVFSSVAQVEMYSFERSRLEKEDCYCSFLIRDADELPKLLGGATFMEYVLTAKIPDDDPTNGFEKVPKVIRCDMFKPQAKLQENFEGFVKYEFKDYLSIVGLTCSFLPHSKLFAGYKSTDAKYPISPLKEVTSVKCENKNEKQPTRAPEWEYKILHTDGTFNWVKKDDEFDAFCAVPVDSACTDLTLKGTLPPKFKQDPTGKVSLTCASGQRLLVDAIDGETKFYPDEKERPFCKNSRTVNTANWHIKHEEGDFEFKQAECTIDILCKYAAKINNDCSVIPSNCGNLTKSMDVLRCNVQYALTVKQLSEEKVTADTLKCDFLKGRWTTATKGKAPIEVDDNANISCERKPDESPSGLPREITEKITWGIISVIALVIILFIVRMIIQRS